MYQSSSDRRLGLLFGDATVDLRVGAADRSAAAVEIFTQDTFQAILDFSGSLDLKTLNQAWRMLGARYPILRGYLASSQDQTWTLDAELPDIDVTTDPSPETGLYPGREETSRLVADRTMVSQGLTNLLVVRRPRGDRVVLNTHHGLMDAHSSVEVVTTLASIYDRLTRGGAIEIVPDARSRRLEDVIEASDVGLATQALATGRYLGRWASCPTSNHPTPANRSAAGWAAADISHVLVIASELRRRKGWAASAVFVPLLARGWNRVFGDGVPLPGPNGWQVASDLRVELGVDGGIGNFSSTEPLTLVDVDRDDLLSLVAETNRDFAGLRSTWPGLGGGLSAIGTGSMAPVALRQTMSASLNRVMQLGYGRSFSNVGQWPTAASVWGDVACVGAYFVPAMSEVELTTIACTSISGHTWISMRTQSPGISVADVEQLGASMLADARTLCA